MDQNKVIKRIQLRQQKIKLLEQQEKDMAAKKRKFDEDMAAKKRKFDEQLRTMAHEKKSMENLLETDHSSYLLSCLGTINLDPLKDRAIILGSLAILAEKIKAGTANAEIDNAIKKYKELKDKGLINEMTFEEEEKA